MAWGPRSLFLRVSRRLAFAAAVGRKSTISVSQSPLRITILSTIPLPPSSPPRLSHHWHAGLLLDCRFNDLFGEFFADFADAVPRCRCGPQPCCKGLSVVASRWFCARDNGRVAILIKYQ